MLIVASGSLDEVCVDASEVTAVATEAINESVASTESRTAA
jgi:hypothetical protein